MGTSRPEASIARAAAALGALLLAGEAAVHVEQFAALFYDVRWIGPLFLANAAACVLAIVGLWRSRTRSMAALGGIAISALALGALILSYGVGLFGWQEAGFRTVIGIAVACEVAAVIVLPAALMTATSPREGHR